MLNYIRVLLDNIFSKLATWKPPEATAAILLGYAYDIANTDE